MKFASKDLWTVEKKYSPRVKYGFRNQINEESEEIVEIFYPIYMHPLHFYERKTRKSINSQGVSVVGVDRNKLVLHGPSSVMRECEDITSTMSSDYLKKIKTKIFAMTDDVYNSLNKSNFFVKCSVMYSVGIERTDKGVALTGRLKTLERIKSKLIFHTLRLTLPIYVIDMNYPVYFALYAKGHLMRLERKYNVKFEKNESVKCKIRGLNCNNCATELNQLLEGGYKNCVKYGGRIFRSAYFDKAIKKISREFDVHVYRKRAYVIGKRAESAAAAIQNLYPNHWVEKKFIIEGLRYNLVQMENITTKIEMKHRVMIEYVSVEFRVFGTKEDIENAEAEIIQFYDDSIKNTRIEFPISKQDVRHFIGKDGLNIGSYRHYVVAEVLDRNTSPIIVLCGRLFQCEDAKRLILDCLPTEKKVEIDSSLHSALIGIGGHRIKKLCKDRRVRVKFGDSSNVLVKSSGFDLYDGVKSLKKEARRLKLEVNYRPIGYSKKLKVESFQIGLIIGWRGMYISKIRRMFKVAINVDQNVDLGFQVTITGDQENVENAYSTLARKLASKNGEVLMTLNVAPTINALLVDKERIREIKDEFEVVVNLSKTTENVVEIIGIPERVKQCVEYIQSLVDENVED